MACLIALSEGMFEGCGFRFLGLASVGVMHIPLSQC